MLLDLIDYKQKVYRLKFCYKHFSFVPHKAMTTNTNKKPQPQNYEFQTPIKPKQLRLVDETTITQKNYDKANQSHIQNSNTSLSMFKKKRNPKRIKKSSLRMLSLQCEALQSYKHSITESYSDSVNDSYQQQLDKIFVIVARITQVDNDKKYFIFHCQDQGQMDFKLYINKHSSKDFQTRLFNHNQKISENRWIKNVDQLEFESIPGQGVPYFKFFVILREIPIFNKSEQNPLSNEQKIDDQSNKGVEDSGRKKFLSHIKGVQFRAYVEHFQKVQDFNQLIYHNMHLCFEAVCEQFLANKTPQDIQI